MSPIKRFAMLGFVALLIGGCSAGASGSPGVTSAGRGVVYYLLPELLDEFQAGAKQLMEADGQALGYEVRSLNANNSSLTQVSQMDSAISQHPQAIILNAVDVSAMVSSVQKAKAAGIPVFVFDREYTASPVDFTSETGTVKMGEIAATETVRLLTKKNGGPKGTVLEITGDLADSYAVGVGKGFDTTIAKSPEIKLTVKTATGYDAAVAVSALESQIAANGLPDLLFIHCDGCWTQALAASLQGKNIAKGALLMIGTGGLPVGLQSIRDGWLTETVQAPLPEQTAGLWQYLPDVVAHKTIPAGTVDIQGLQSQIMIESWGPTLRLPGSVIDAQNVGDPSFWGNMKVTLETPAPSPSQ